MVHVVDTDEELMWTDDHHPPTPTSQWKPGQTIEYTRTVFVPDLSVRRRRDDSDRAAIRRRDQKRLAADRATTSASTPTRSRTSSCCRRPTTCSRSSRTAGIRPRRRRARTPPSSGSGRRRTRRSRSRTRRRTPFSTSTSTARAPTCTATSRSRSRSAARRVDQFTLKPERARAPEDGSCRPRRWAPRRWPSCRSSWIRRSCPMQVNRQRQQGSARAGRPRLPRLRRSRDDTNSASACVAIARRAVPARRAGAGPRGARLFFHGPHDVGEGASRRGRQRRAPAAGRRRNHRCGASVIARIEPDEVPYPEPEAEVPDARGVGLQPDSLKSG